MARSVLGQFGQAAVGPLLAAMHGTEASLKIEVIRTLAGIGARDAVPFFSLPRLLRERTKNCGPLHNVA